MALSGTTVRKVYSAFLGSNFSTILHYDIDYGQKPTDLSKFSGYTLKA